MSLTRSCPVAETWPPKTCRPTHLSRPSPTPRPTLTPMSMPKDKERWTIGVVTTCNGGHVSQRKTAMTAPPKLVALAFLALSLFNPLAGAGTYAHSHARVGLHDNLLFMSLPATPAASNLTSNNDGGDDSNSNSNSNTSINKISEYINAISPSLPRERQKRYNQVRGGGQEDSHRNQHMMEALMVSWPHAAAAGSSTSAAFTPTSTVARTRERARLKRSEANLKSKVQTFRPEATFAANNPGSWNTETASVELRSTQLDQDHAIDSRGSAHDDETNAVHKDKVPAVTNRAPSKVISNANGNSSSSNKLRLLAFFAANLAVVTAASKFGILNGPPLALTAEDEMFGPYTDALVAQDFGATIAATALAVAFVKVIGLLNDVAGVSPTVTRKLVHTLTAPLFMLVWPLFSQADGARFFAGVVSLTNLLRLYWAGKNPTSSLARSVSRSGDSTEALEGPFVYVCIVHLTIWCLWRATPVGVVALSTMAAGDGMADLVGRKWGKNNQWDDTLGWTFAKGKSVAGTVAFAVAATATSVGLLAWLSAWGCLTLPEALSWTDVAIRVAGISTTCAFIELLPVGDDNFTVPFSAALLAALLLT